MTGALERLADLVGLEPDYRDAFGETRRASRDSISAVLAALGFLTDDKGALAEEADALARRDAERLLEPVVVAWEDAQPVEVAVAPPEAPGAIRWRLIAEDGTVSEGHLVPGDPPSEKQERRAAPTLVLPALPRGYHRLEVEAPDGAAAWQSVIIAPRQCYLPAGLEKNERTWGFALQLYGLRSGRNWGLGDFTDLREVVALGGRFGAGAVGLNPLHANYWDDPEHASPYSPSSRDTFNPLYLDVEAIEDFAECKEARLKLADPVLQAELDRLRATEFVDYRNVAAAKRPILEMLYRHFRAHHLDRGESARGRAFRAFEEEQGISLRRFATFLALRHAFAAEDPGLADWRRWPETYRDPASAEVEAFAREHAEEIEFHAYLQWQAKLQLDHVKAAAEAMPVGLIVDLALGSDAGGAEGWSGRGLYVTGASLGAPPDELNLLGQNWGLPPMNPLVLRARAYAPFIEVLRANMRHAGALRIDHILGLMRQYWIPEGHSASDGVYIRFPFDDLLKVLALESHRQRCLVIGEDLGTVPEGLRDRLRAAEVLSYRLLFFERDDDGGFRAPADYPREALVAATTHDLPTLPAWWQGADIALRNRLELYPTPEKHDEDVRQRECDRDLLRGALRREGLRAENESETPVEACTLYLARTPSRILLVQFEDLLGETEPVNVPGTSDEYPNWRRKLPADLEEIATLARLHKLAAELRRERDPRPEPAPPESAWAPRATYRLQLNAGFDFDQAAGIADYLAALGIGHVYVSSYLRARSGSLHGYDVIDHGTLNPEIGGETALERFTAALRAQGLGQILDFVPNHMCVGQADNPYWLDVLRWGRASPHARVFDIDWRPQKPELENRVLLPFLGDHYGQVLSGGDLVLRFDPEAGSFDVWYHEHRFPIAPPDYAEFIAAGLAGAGRRGGAEVLRELEEGFRRLQGIGRYGPETRRRGEAYRKSLRRLAREAPEAVEALHRGAAAFAGTPGEGESFQPLHDLLERQAYRLAYWRVAASEINYRRFFDINDLAGIRVEDAVVFEAIHRLVGRLVAEGRLHGLRIDHVDGLRDPRGYLSDLRRLLSELRPNASGPHRPVYVAVEKILEPDEALRGDWPVAGTTGYDFMNLVLGVFIDPAGQEPLDALYEAFGGDNDFADILYRAKHDVIDSLLLSELEGLATSLDRVAEQGWRTRDYTRSGLFAALREVAACFPVYRTYVTPEGCSEEDRAVIAGACAQAARRWPPPDRVVFDFLKAVLTGDLAHDPQYDAPDVHDVAQRFQQYTSPVMAKSLEDTAFYRFHRLVALNEVGGNPANFGVTLVAFHEANVERARSWPWAMLAVATHDNKRGADIRARLAVLSELNDEWGQAVQRWHAQAADVAKASDAGGSPAMPDSYLLYQTLLGAWPVELLDAPLETADQDLADFRDRIQGYMTKALREAKLRTSWSHPDEAYEETVADFVAAILDRERAADLLADMQRFARRVAWLGALNSLAQSTLHLTCPGVPDVYQGGELWDLSLVDPDNRRPVDFARRRALLAELPELEGVRPDNARELLATWPDGRIKLHLLSTLLHLRAGAPALLREGDYVPLAVEGAHAKRVVAFQRKAEGREVLVLAGRLLAPLYDQGREANWSDTAVALPSAYARYRDLLTGQELAPGDKTLSVAKVFAVMPTAVLEPV